MTYFFTLDNAVSSYLQSKAGEPVSLVQIGAHDGKFADPLHTHIMAHANIHALLVEPLFMSELRATYADRPNTDFAQTAITEQNGTCFMRKCISPDAWMKGVSHVKDGGAMHKRTSYDDYEEVAVASRTLDTLFREHATPNVDIFASDVEGYDYKVLKQLDFAQFHPSIIHIEYTNLPREEQLEAKRLLKENGYQFINKGLDLIAVTPELLTRMAEPYHLEEKYAAWLERGAISKENLPYAVALLASAAGNLMGHYVGEEADKRVAGQVLTPNLSRSTGNPFPNVPEAMTAISDMAGLFCSRGDLLDFLDQEMPPAVKEHMHTEGIVR